MCKFVPVLGHHVFSRDNVKVQCARAKWVVGFHFCCSRDLFCGGGGGIYLLLKREKMKRKTQEKHCIGRSYHLNQCNKITIQIDSLARKKVVHCFAGSSMKATCSVSSPFIVFHQVRGKTHQERNNCSFQNCRLKKTLSISNLTR